MNKSDGEIAALIADLDHADKRKIRVAADTLLFLAAQSAELRAALAGLLLDPSRKNQWAVAYVLGQLPRPNGKVIEALLQSLDHPSPDIRWAIGLLLVRIAKREKDLISRFVELCHTGNPAQKRMALYCLRDLHLDGAESVIPLLNALKDPDPTVRVAAAISLKARPDMDEAGRAALVQCFLDDPDLRVRNAAAVTLAHLGLPSEKFIAALEKANASDDARLKKVAAAALATLKNKRSAPSGS